MPAHELRVPSSFTVDIPFFSHCVFLLQPRPRRHLFPAGLQTESGQPAASSKTRRLHHPPPSSSHPRIPRHHSAQPGLFLSAPLARPALHSRFTATVLLFEPTLFVPASALTHHLPPHGAESWPSSWLGASMTLCSCLLRIVFARPVRRSVAARSLNIVPISLLAQRGRYETIAGSGCGCRCCLVARARCRKRVFDTSAGFLSSFRKIGSGDRTRPEADTREHVAHS